MAIYQIFLYGLAQIKFLGLLFGLMLMFRNSVKAQICKNLLQQLPTPKIYQGYQCILDSENNIIANSVSRIYITNQNFQFIDQKFSLGNCNEQILINPNPEQQYNDVLFDFNGNSGQMLAYAQISYDSNFYLQNGNYATEVGILAYHKNGDSYLNKIVSISQQNSQQKCMSNYYKQSEYQLISFSTDTSYFTFQTYIHPGSLPGIISNIQVMIYFKCPIGCSQCTNNGVCSACITNYNLKNNYCYINCNSNQYAVIIDINSTEQNCQLCDPSCLTCFGTSVSCTSCINNYFINSNQQCQQCDQSCLNCTGDSKSCFACANSYYPLITGQQQSVYQCFQTCPNNYFLNNNQCQQCDQSCQTCTGNSQNCTQCSNGYIPLYSSPTDQTFICYQICPNGYNLQQNQCQICLQLSSYACLNCAATCRSCQKNQTNNCLDCYQTMNLNGSTCVCKNNQDQRNNFYQCSYNNYAVVQATFDGSSPTLILEFGSPLIQINNLQCNQVFDSSTLNLLGSNSICKITSTQIIVTLSDDAIIMANSTISFNTQANILQFQGYQNTIDTIYLTQVVQQLVASPSVNVQYNKIVNSCDDILFEIQSIQNDAQRGFLQFQWSLTLSQTFDDLTLQNLNSLIQTANNQQSQTLLISKYTIPPDTSISINLQYILKIYQTNSLTFTTLNQKSKQVIIQSIQNKYPPIYRYMDLQFIFSFFVQICDQSGASITQEPLNIQIISNNMPSLSQTQNKFIGQQIEVDVKSYSIPQGTILDIQVQALLDSNQSISSSQNFSITPELSNLFIAITSGLDGLVNYKKEYVITGLAIDYEVQDVTSPQGIQLTWQCQILGQSNGNLQCYDYLNQVYVPPQNVLNVTIAGGTFNPYQSLQFTLTGKKDTRISKQIALLIFTEIDIPPLYIQFDDPTQLQQVNINDNISATLIYGSNVSSDILTYAGAVLYNNNVVGIIKFDYYKVKLRIWDYFSNLNQDNLIVQIRFTVYNPANIMPSLSVTNFNINLPPQKCSLSVSPLNGIALQTKFTILFTGCTTSNNPLTYQFFYYNQMSDKELEVQKPQNILRRQIQDQSISPQIITTLPSGNLLIIGQAMDSYLAVFNSTIQLNVLPYQQSEQLLLNTIDQSIKNIITLPVKNSILDLCVIAEEISKSNSVYTLASVNQRKITLISTIFNLSNQLPSSSFLSTFASKVISQLQSTLMNSDDSQNQNVLNQIDSVLQNQQQLIANSISNKLLANNDIVLQNIIDSYKIFNATTKSVDTINTSYNILQSQMNVSDQIGNLLNSISLPNSGQFQLQGNLISLNCEKITSKNLQKYFFDDNQSQQSDQSIYNIVMTNYSQNPFVQTNGFQSYVNQLKNITPDIQISMNPVIKPLIQNTSNKINLNQNKTLQLSFPNIQQSKYNLSCIQQQDAQSSWSSKNCEIVNSKQIGGYYCFCQDQKPTTIAEDLQSVLNNKNLQTAFGSQGLYNITHFTDFYEYAIFWILSFVTLFQIGLCYIGKTLDKKQFNIQRESSQPHIIYPLPQQIKEVQQQQQSQQQQQQSNQYQQQQSPQLFTQSPMLEQNVEQLIQQDLILDQSKVQNQLDKDMNYIMNWNIPQDSRNIFYSIKQAQQQAELNKQNLERINDDKINQNVFENNSNLKLEQNDSENKLETQNNNQNQGNLNQNQYEDQIIKEDKIIKEEDNIVLKIREIYQKLLKVSFIKRILVFHYFFSIFFIHDEQLPRTLRFTIFYLRIVHSLSISTIFDQQYDEVQMIIVSIINTSIIVISIILIQTLYKLRKVGRVISSFIMLFLLALYYYILLAVISGQSEENSNKKISSFFIMFGFDFFVISAFISFINIFVLTLVAKQVQNKLILKIYYFLKIQDTIQRLIL
ncbi:REJ domain protein (macronuclear) [Tetrahymena thermophila SB210]|uniref:REJ domain protein n=1 Tax=Tetrahymena thermophila (strain SB210) TaxID=312017 RepID=W7XC50_TETTS|nr:REJ domain protein [Tetrahymena thermophila SB210]EWS74073.1 REJ domain protein [Tetrahymena thermophila SB210]|eukprot:XP_012653406.1 REJ domain protein [Tetrahymena thermophila SB210]